MKKNTSLETILGINLTQLMERNASLNTVDAVAQRSGVGRGTVQRVKKAQVSTSLENVEKLAAAFNVNPATLLSPGLQESRGLSLREDFIEIAVLNVQASMGAGIVAPPHEDVIDRMTVSASWLRNTVRFSSPENLGLITAYGDSMEGTFADGDMLLVDRGVDDVKIDAVYVLMLNDELYIKRLQRRPDRSIQMISDNKKYEPYTIKNGELDQFRVMGRVLLVWNAIKL